MASRASIPDPVLLTLAHAKDAPATSSAKKLMHVGGSTLRWTEPNTPSRRNVDAEPGFGCSRADKQDDRLIGPARLSSSILH
jgi:hypothetical protein